MSLTNYTLRNSPWSDSFWPINKGLIGRRFADPGYPGVKNWIENFNYIQARPAWTMGTSEMSPAEKYDLLVGDRGWTLTDKVWSKGTKYIKKYGFVPAWTGLCHGWAPASFMFNRPMKSVSVNTYHGGSVTFYPSDIKALASQLWGEAPPIVKFVGRRCKKFSPQEDEIGRVTSDTCFDVNPGTFHMAIVNQLGVAQRSFVMDSTWDYEVWNYPVYAYQYHYFNPQTLAVSRRMGGMSIPVERYTIDKFKKYRGSAAKSVIGVSMDVTYAIPVQPSRRVIEKDKYHTVRYLYDLELDETGAIVGGEWYSNFHPDFLWNPTPDSKAQAKIEKKLDAPLVWDGQGPVNAQLHEAAKRASSRVEPLSVIVERLVQLAAETDTTGSEPSEPPVESEPEIEEEPEPEPELLPEA